MELLGLMVGQQHRAIDVGKRDAFRGGDLDADVAEFRQREVEVFLGAGGRLHPVRHGVDDAGRA